MLLSSPYILNEVANVLPFDCYCLCKIYSTTPNNVSEWVCKCVCVWLWSTQRRTYCIAWQCSCVTLYGGTFNSVKCKSQILLSPCVCITRLLVYRKGASVPVESVTLWCSHVQHCFSPEILRSLTLLSPTTFHLQLRLKYSSVTFFFGSISIQSVLS